MADGLRVRDGKASDRNIAFLFDGTFTGLVSADYNFKSINEIIKATPHGVIPFHDIFPPIVRFYSEGDLADIFIPLNDRLVEGAVDFTTGTREKNMCPLNGNVMIDEMPIMAVENRSVFVLSETFAKQPLTAFEVAPNLYALRDKDDQLIGFKAKNDLNKFYSEDRFIEGQDTRRWAPFSNYVGILLNIIFRIMTAILRIYRAFIRRISALMKLIPCLARFSK